MAERVSFRLALGALFPAGAILILAACGAGSTPTSTASITSSPPPEPAATTAASAPAAATPAGSPSPTEAGSASIAPTFTPRETAAAVGPLIPGIGLVTLTSPASGAGMRPQLTWEPVEGAVIYRVTVFHESGRPYWFWEGSEASTFFGGGAQPLPDEAPGPIVFDGMSWVVFAADAAGRPIAASEITPLSP